MFVFYDRFFARGQWLSGVHHFRTNAFFLFFIFLAGYRVGIQVTDMELTCLCEIK